MTSTQPTTTKTKHYYLKGLAVVLVALAVAGALAMSFAGYAQAEKKKGQEDDAQQRSPGGGTVQGPFIAFTSDRDVTGGLEIYKMNEYGSKQKNLTNNPANDHQPAVSPDGSKIAFVSTRDGVYNPEIYVMNADGSNQRRITRNDESKGYFRAVDEAPAWSPDGTKLAFMSQRNGNPEIHTMDADTGDNVENITNNQAWDTAPSWSPDGVTIAFETNRDGQSEIYMMDAHGNNPYHLARGNEVNYAPDPYIEYANRAFTGGAPNQNGDGYNSEIFEMSYLGLTKTNLTKNDAQDWLASYSGDGTKLAFTSDRSGNWDIYKMNRDGSSQVQLTTNAANDYDPDWAKKAPSQ